jgi:hypothetical protein
LTSREPAANQENSCSEWVRTQGREEDGQPDSERGDHGGAPDEVADPVQPAAADQQHHRAEHGQEQQQPGDRDRARRRRHRGFRGSEWSNSADESSAEQVMRNH